MEYYACQIRERSKLSNSFMNDIYTIFDKSRNAQPVFNFISIKCTFLHLYVPISAGRRGPYISYDHHHYSAEWIRFSLVDCIGENAFLSENT